MPSASSLGFPACSACKLRAPDLWWMLREGRELIPGPAETLADSICVGHPRNWRKALAAVRESQGAFVAVPDEAILDSMRVTGRLSGVFGEPAGVAGLAGLRAAVATGIVSRRATALAVVTGSGLKDVRTALKAAGAPDSLKPDDGELAAYLKARPIAPRASRAGRG